MLSRQFRNDLIKTTKHLRAQGKPRKQSSSYVGARSRIQSSLQDKMDSVLQLLLLLLQLLRKVGDGHWLGLVKNIGGTIKIWGWERVGNNWWNHKHFSIIGGMCPGCPPKSAPMGMVALWIGCLACDAGASLLSVRQRVRTLSKTFTHNCSAQLMISVRWLFEHLWAVEGRTTYDCCVLWLWHHRDNNGLRGIPMCMFCKLQECFLGFLIPCEWETDRQTDRQTEGEVERWEGSKRSSREFSKLETSCWNSMILLYYIMLHNNATHVTI